MDYKKFFFDSIANLKKKGEYRIFKDIGRMSGSFPIAKNNDLKKNNDIINMKNAQILFHPHLII